MSERVPHRGKRVKTFPLINLRDSTGWSAPIHAAAKSGNVKLVAWMIDNGAECEVRDAQHVTPMHSSVLIGDDALDLTKRIYAMCPSMSHDMERRWILSLDAMTKLERTVMDDALAADEAGRATVAWLLEQGAASSVDVGDMLEQKEEERRKLSAEKERARRAGADGGGGAAADPRAHVPVPGPAKTDPLSKRIRQERREERRVQRRRDAERALMRAVRVVQAAVRGWLIRAHGTVTSAMSERDIARMKTERTLRIRVQQQKAKAAKRAEKLRKQRETKATRRPSGTARSRRRSRRSRTCAAPRCSCGCSRGRSCGRSGSRPGSGRAAPWRPRRGADAVQRMGGVAPMESVLPAERRDAREAQQRRRDQVGPPRRARPPRRRAAAAGGEPAGRVRAQAKRRRRPATQTAKPWGSRLGRR